MAGLTSPAVWTAATIDFTEFSSQIRREAFFFLISGPATCCRPTKASKPRSVSRLASQLVPSESAISWRGLNSTPVEREQRTVSIRIGRSTGITKRLWEEGGRDVLHKTSLHKRRIFGSLHPLYYQGFIKNPRHHRIHKRTLTRSSRLVFSKIHLRSSQI